VPGHAPRPGGDAAEPEARLFGTPLDVAPDHCAWAGVRPDRPAFWELPATGRRARPDAHILSFGQIESGTGVGGQPVATAKMCMAGELCTATWLISGSVT